MTYPGIIHTDRAAQNVMTAYAAENRLFDAYGLPYLDHDVDVHGLRVRVLELGEGAPLVILPGLLGGGWTMAPLLHHLRDRRVLLVNLPGAGLSDGIDFRSISLRQLALEVTASVLDRFGIDRAELVAGGIGGAWAFWFAIEYPRRVSVITQLGCPALLSGMRVPLRLRLLSIPLLNRILLRKLIPRSPDAVRAVAAGFGYSPVLAGGLTHADLECAHAFAQIPSAQSSMLALCESTLSPGGVRERHAIQPDELRHVKAPVQFIWGEHDPFGDLDFAGNTVVAVPSAILHEIPGGHLPWWDDPAQCAEWIAAFHQEVLDEGEVSGPSLLRQSQPPAAVSGLRSQDSDEPET